MARAEPSLAVPARLSNLSRIRGWLDRVLSDWDTPDAVRADLALAVTELCTNIIRHGYAGARGAIHLSASRRADSVQISIVDDAPGFRPAAVKNQRRGALREGGYGLPLIRSLADEVVYEALGERGNRVILTKHQPRTS